jgi:hypothetical protein
LDERKITIETIILKSSQQNLNVNTSGNDKYKINFDDLDKYLSIQNKSEENTNITINIRLI